jgi:phosphohistidine phosphatase
MHAQGQEAFTRRQGMRPVQTPVDVPTRSQVLGVARQGGTSVKLYFFRHGPAMSRADWDGPDDKRPLTDEGAAITRDVSQRLAGMGLPIDAILTSPYTRALQTAQILDKALGVTGLLKHEPGLKPARFTRDSLDAMLKKHAGAAGVVLIGHEPSMTAVISDLIGGGDLVLKKAGLARVDIDPEAGSGGALRWLFPPKML